MSSDCCTNETALASAEFKAQSLLYDRIAHRVSMETVASVYFLSLFQTHIFVAVGFFLLLVF